MPGGAKLFDRFTATKGSTVVGDPTWDAYIGPGFAELFTRKIDAFFRRARPAERRHVHAQPRRPPRRQHLLLRAKRRLSGRLAVHRLPALVPGPVPSDLAYLMSSGSVLPEVYSGEGLSTVLRAFYDQFMASDLALQDYTYDKFVEEFAMMTTVPIVYFVGMGAAYWQGGARNELATRIELGGQGVTEADLTPEELRQRMWWRKAFANYRSNLKTFEPLRPAEEPARDHRGPRRVGRTPRASALAAPPYLTAKDAKVAKGSRACSACSFRHPRHGATEFGRPMITRIAGCSWVARTARATGDEGRGTARRRTPLANLASLAVRS